MRSVKWKLLGELCASSCVLALSSCGQSDLTKGEPTSSGKAPIIYGVDNRHDVYEYSDAAWAARIAEFSAALVAQDRIDTTDPNDVRITGPTLQEYGVCADERFSQELTSAGCSGTLIASDLLLIAGHCVSASTCPTDRFVFNYYMTGPTTLARITANDVYGCSRVEVDQQSAPADYAVVRLDRPVIGRTPAKIQRGFAALGVGTALSFNGCPTGLPQKITDGANVSASNAQTLDYFQGNLDGFPGSSGSGVFRADTHDLVGILVRGPSVSYVYDSAVGCARPVVVPDNFDVQVDSTYVSAAMNALCAVDFRPELCTCHNGVCEPDMGETSVTCHEDCGTVCGDGTCNGAENEISCYADCGVCGNRVCEPYEEAHQSCCYDCGCPDGFACSDGACQLRPGNANADTRVDAADAQSVDRYVAGLAPKPFQTSAADVNCDGRVTSADSSLIRQFAGGSIGAFPCQDVVATALGDRHTCALERNGHVRCWGANDPMSGQLGYPGSPQIGDDEPARVARDVAIGGKVTQLVSGRAHLCALLDTGNVRCWGDNAFAQLGYGHTRSIGNNELPATAGDVDVGGRVVKLAAGNYHTCALLDTGNLRCWGSNEHGELGHGNTLTIGNNEPPSAAGDVPVGGRVVDVAAGYHHTCAVLDTGSVRCWGSNFLGQLGLGHTNDIGDDELPTSVPPVDLGGSASRIYSYWTHTCAVLRDGSVRCWGSNFWGELGYGHQNNVGDDETPASAGPVNMGGGVRSLALGEFTTCALYTSGNVRCWGLNYALGYGTTDPAIGIGLSPAQLPNIQMGGSVAQLSNGEAHRCALLTTGALRCWGYAYNGQLGYGNTNSVGDDEYPAAAGNVPLYPYPIDPAWQFVNPYDLEVWMLDQGSNLQGTATSLFVKNRGTQAVSNFKTRYFFTTLESQTRSAAVQDNYTPWSTPSVGQEQLGYLKYLEEDFAGRTLQAGQETSGGRGGGEMTRIHFSDWANLWKESDDYSASDKLPAGEWRLTQRVQVYDSAGTVIYGWKR